MPAATSANQAACPCAGANFPNPRLTVAHALREVHLVPAIPASRLHDRQVGRRAGRHVDRQLSGRLPCTSRQHHKQERQSGAALAVQHGQLACLHQRQPEPTPALTRLTAPAPGSQDPVLIRRHAQESKLAALQAIALARAVAPRSGAATAARLALAVGLLQPYVEALLGGVGASCTSGRASSICL